MIDTESLMQLIFIGYDVLCRAINEPMTGSHLGCQILNKFLLLITS